MIFGGQWWSRTTRAKRNGFTDRPATTYSITTHLFNFKNQRGSSPYNILYPLFIRLPRKQVWILRSYLNTSCPSSKSQFSERIVYLQLSPAIQKYQFLILLYYCRCLWATRALTLPYSLVTKTSQQTLLLAFPWFAKVAKPTT